MERHRRLKLNNTVHKRVRVIQRTVLSDVMGELESKVRDIYWKRLRKGCEKSTVILVQFQKDVVQMS